jgi:hypothetical protein
MPTLYAWDLNLAQFINAHCLSFNVKTHNACINYTLTKGYIDTRNLVFESTIFATTNATILHGTMVKNDLQSHI